MSFPYLFPSGSGAFKSLIPSPSGSICSALTKVLLQLPLALFNFINTLIDTNGNLTVTFLSMIYTPGETKMSFVPLDSVQNGVWVKCDGSQYAKTQYPDLYAAIGDVFASQTNPNIYTLDGSGNKVITAAPSVSAGNFRVPDCRALVMVGAGNFATIGAISVGNTFGEEGHALTEAEGAQDYLHTHTTGKFASGSGGGADDPGLLTAGTSSIQPGDADPLQVCAGGGSSVATSTTDAATGSLTFTGPVDQPDDYDYATKVKTPFAMHNTVQPGICCYIYIFAGVPVT